MGRRRRRVVRIVKKKLPTVFVCPRCGEEAVRVTIAKDTGHATVLCALCNLKDDFPAHPAAQAIDVYSYFTDRFYGVKDPRAIIPRDREMIQAPPEEPEEEEATAPPAPSVPEVKPEPPSIEVDVQPAPSSQAVESTSVTSAPAEESKTEAEPQIEEKESDEEAEPFADILENKDKKRYSSQPLPQQSTEQTS